MDFFKQNIIPGEVIVQLVAFLVVFWTLKRFAWGPLQNALEARRQKIRSDFDSIDAGRKEIDALKAEYAGHIQKIEEEARVKLQDAIDEGRRIARDLQDKARAEAQETFEKAKENLNLEIAKARIELKREIASLSIQIAEKVINEKAGDASQNDRVMAMIDEIGTSGKGL